MHSPRKKIWPAVILALGLFRSIGVIPVETTVAATTDEVKAATEKASEAVQDAGEAAQDKLDQFWRRVDEKRLKNRTPDQIAAWIIMGFLTGGLIYRFSKLKWYMATFLGLAGAFVGGIAANLIHLDLGLAPILIRYEELFASFAGGIVILIIARWTASRRADKK
jgi:uncharacterized membrane protein YeaQ/YmgE (transglycosylase-associated protein family)